MVAQKTMGAWHTNDITQVVAVATGVVEGHYAIGLCRFEVIASKLSLRDTSQLKLRCWLMCVRSKSVEIIPNACCGANFARHAKAV